MKRAILSSVALLLFAVPAFPKGETVKISIEGGSLKAPITLTDPQVVATFNVWSGPGTFARDLSKTKICPPDSSREVKSYAPSFVVDWPKGIVAAPSQALSRYKISFWSSNDPGKLAYVVTYVFDPAFKQGYIYLPGAGDDGYRINTGSLARWVGDTEVEGNWFRSWTAWDRFAASLLAAAG
jgi:hypothetical protein